MRSFPIILGCLFVVGLVFAMAPGVEARPSPACVDAVSPTCPGVYCLDDNLDGKFQYDECLVIYCLHGCCGPCPPPEWD